MANKKITDLMSGTPVRDSLLESAIDISGTMDSRKVKAGAVADLNNVQIASEYDDTATYAYGAYCIKDGVLYRCTTAISVAEAWDSTHWTAVMVTGEYKRVRIMTKAQFDLLSNDEKDGFIYVSDYPTKIQDIDNVTLTTSDNNKLLGVSVVGSDISVGAVEFDYQYIYPSSVSVPYGSFKEIASLTLNKGTYIVTGYHEWSSGFTDNYVDQLYGQNVRNLSGQNGGGYVFTTIIVITNDNTNLSYQTYLYGSTNRTASNISLKAIKIK